MILLIDNYDSFVHNLARYFRRLGQATHVVRNDAITPDEIRRMSPDAVVLSPGPCSPNEAGVSLEVVRTFVRRIPLLGVCLGHQTIASALGGAVVRSEKPMHGRSSLITHDGTGVFVDVPSRLTVGRYHSLIVASRPWPSDLRVTATTDDGDIMAIQHREAPVFGLQFHPESVLTEYGYQLLANFLKQAGLSPALPLPASDDECAQPSETPLPLGNSPVTF